jgi:hypothetical protein
LVQVALLFKVQTHPLLRSRQQLVAVMVALPTIKVVLVVRVVDQAVVLLPLAAQQHQVKVMLAVLVTYKQVLLLVAAEVLARLVQMQLQELVEMEALVQPLILLGVQQHQAEKMSEELITFQAVALDNLGTAEPMAHLVVAAAELLVIVLVAALEVMELLIQAAAEVAAT